MNLLINRVLTFLVCMLLGTQVLLGQDVKFEPDTTLHFDFDFELSEALAADSMVAYIEEDSISLDLPDQNYIPQIHMDVIADRLNCLNTQIPLTVNKTVCGFIHFFLVRKRNYTQTMLERQGYYFPVFEKYLTKYNLPDELKYLAVVESGLKFDAKSRTGAMGLWQFMPGTGKDFRMAINQVVDERMHLEKSTEGACRFLKILYNQFGDWDLALAAYNCGPGNVRKAIRNSGGKTFWEVYNHLPQETRSYVPQFIALVYAMNFASEHNLYPDTDSLMTSIETDTIRTSKHVDLARLEKLLQVDSSILRRLNPHLSKNIYACNLPYPLCIPANRKQFFIDNQISWEDSSAINLPLSTAALTKANSTKWLYHSVKKKETLVSVSKRYQVPVAQLLSWNGLSSRKKLRFRQRLKVGRDTESADLVISIKKPVSNHIPVAEKATNNSTPLVYFVKSNEGLFAVGRKFGVSVSDLVAWNNLKTENLSEGQKLVIHEKNNDSLANKSETVANIQNQKLHLEKIGGNDSTTTNHLKSEQFSTKEIAHRVKKGQGLFTLAKLYHVDVKLLKLWNNIESEQLKVGQIIHVKLDSIIYHNTVNQPVVENLAAKSNPKQPELKYYRVQKGDTIYSITRKYEITAKELIKKNNLKSKVLKPGQKLLIS